jgi:Rieske Fe-S protein
LYLIVLSLAPDKRAREEICYHRPADVQLAEEFDSQKSSKGGACVAELNRRDFVATTAGSVALAVLECQHVSAEQKEDGQTTIDIGKPSGYPAGTLSDRFAKSNKLLVANYGGKIYVMTAVCTHRKGTIALKDGKFHCPRHGSLFPTNGQVEKGPATGSLVRFGITLNDKGNLIVDQSKVFREDAWNNPASYFRIGTP